MPPHHSPTKVAEVCLDTVVWQSYPLPNGPPYWSTNLCRPPTPTEVYFQYMPIYDYHRILHLRIYVLQSHQPYMSLEKSRTSGLLQDRKDVHRLPVRKQNGHHL